MRSYFQKKNDDDVARDTRPGAKVKKRDDITLPDEGDKNDPRRVAEMNERKQAQFYGTIGGAKLGTVEAESETPKKKFKKAESTSTWDGEKKQLATAGAEAGKGYSALGALLDRLRGNKGKK